MEQVVKEPVFGVPHLITIVPDPIHGVRDPKEMLQETQGDVLIDGVVLGQNQCDLHHALTVECHPSRAVGLIQVTPCGELSATVEHPNIVQTEKSPGEDILS